MPTPIGHSLAAVILNESKSVFNFYKGKSTILVALLLCNLADIDFLPGFLMGNPNKYHHHATHSLGAALIVGLIFAFLGKKNEKRSFWVLFAFATTLYFSHVILDYFAADTSQPRGVPIFWPISNEYHIAPSPIFSDVHKASSSATFIQSLLVQHNAWTILLEIAILGPLALTALLVKKIKKNQL